MRALFTGARAARLATVRPGGAPHIVPVVFAFDGDEIVTPVDHKPKRTRDLQRIANIRNDPRVALLADAYDDDWSDLWWVRVDGEARIVEPGTAGHRTAAAVLAQRYGQYREHPIAGAIISVAPTGWTGWRWT